MRSSPPLRPTTAASSAPPRGHARRRHGLGHVLARPDASHWHGCGRTAEHRIRVAVGDGRDPLKDLDPAVVAKLAGFHVWLEPCQGEPEAAEGRAPALVTVTVRNGSGTSGLAAQAASILKAQGYRIRGVGNADQFVYDETLIIYKSNARASRRDDSQVAPCRAARGRAVGCTRSTHRARRRRQGLADHGPKHRPGSDRAALGG